MPTRVSPLSFLAAGAAALLAVSGLAAPRSGPLLADPAEKVRMLEVVSLLWVFQLRFESDVTHTPTGVG